jgi:hypothetical protein
MTITTRNARCTELHDKLHMTLEEDTQLPRLPVHCVGILCMGCTVQMEVAGCSCLPYLCLRNSAMGSIKGELRYIQHWEVPSGPQY